MRPFFFLSTLALFLFAVDTFNLAKADEKAVSPAVQEAIDEIVDWGGRYTLTPENTIKSITFADGSELDEEIFELFAEQKDLDTLQITNGRLVNDAAIAQLADLKKMRVFALTNSVISDAAVKRIVEMFPDLVNLNLSYSGRLTDASAREIAKLKQLEVLNLLLCDFSEFGIMSIAALPKLRVLDIRGNMKIGDSGMRTLARLPALRNLQHRGPVSDNGLLALVQAKALDSLMIQDFMITGQSGEYIRQMEKLTSLIIFRCENFDSAGVLALKGLKLNRLTLRGLPIDDSAMEVFGGLPTIRRLFLQELPSITDAGMENIGSLKDLELLEVLLLPITDKSMETIAKLPALKTLALRETNITDAGLESLLKMPNLEAVTIQGNSGVTPAMIQKLKEAEKFRVTE